MRRSLLYHILLLLLASLACSVGGIGKEAVITPTALPTSTPVPNEPLEKSVYDDFSALNDYWSDLFVVTTQAKPGMMKSTAKVVDGKLVFEFQDLETYLYKFITNRAPEDVVIETNAQAFGQAQNGIAVVCRANNEHTAWYEFRVNSLNQYFIYRYDAAQRDAGKNPYILLKNGGLTIDVFGPSKPNTLRVTCKGAELTLEVNGKQIATASDGTLSGKGQTGVGAMSSTLLPVSIKFDYFSYGQP